MSYYPVQRPTDDRPNRTQLPEIAAAVVLFVAALTVAWGAFATVPVVVDGTERRVALGTPVSDLAETGLTTAEPGALRAAADGRVLEPDGGEDPTIFVDGGPVQPGQTVRAPVEIQSVAGEDIVEAVVGSDEPIGIPVVYEGEGPLVTLASTGSVGRRRVVRGAVSGQVLEMLVIEEPAPMVLSRSQPDASDRVVALTFDDGPWPGQTQAVLDILEARDVTATFFMLGLQVRAHPDIARAVADAGHAIGNHTFGHSNLRHATRQEVRDEIDACRDVVVASTGITPTVFRPPGGLLSPSVHFVCQEKQLGLVGWTVDPQDWSGKSADELVNQVIAATEPGAVVLLHDGGGDRTATIAALPRIIDGLRDRGYAFVTVTDLPGR